VDIRCQLLFLTRLLLPNRVHGLAQGEWQDATRLRLKLRDRSCTAARGVWRKDAHQMHAAVDSGSNEIVRQMCELLNYGRVLVPPEVTAL
jgi:hypothetical protein